MDLFLKSDVEGLLDEHQPPCVSIYLPLHHSGPGAEQDPLRAKRLLRRAEDRLEDGGLDAERVKRLLRPLRRQFSSSRFFQEAAAGLAAFCGVDYCRAFFLPLEVPERLEVGERFYVKPLLPLTEGSRVPPGSATAAKPRKRAAAPVPGSQAAQRQAARRFAELVPSGRASNDVVQVLQAANQGRIDVLFLEGDADLWGRFDRSIGGRIQLHPAAEPGDEELLDAAAALTLSRGGTAYAVAHGEVPGGGALAALFRD